MKPSPILTPNQILAQSNHRPWPMPNGPWVMSQTWYDLLFAHWPVDPDTMNSLLPQGLTADTWDGNAWIGVVPFGMSNVTPRFVPPVPWLSKFLELNVRTYVTLDDKPGVYFFSLDAANSVAVSVARAAFHLPYFNAEMNLNQEGDTYHYSSTRTHKNAPPARLRASFTPTSDVYFSTPGNFDHWLTSRYCLYSVHPRTKAIYRGDIQHAPWPLQTASASFHENTMLDGHNIPLSDTPPTLHFSKHIDTVVWPLEKIRDGRA